MNDLTNGIKIFAKLHIFNYSACPGGTYKDEALPGNEKSCIPCPDPKMNSPPASVSLDQCVCEEGFKKVKMTCQQ